MSTEPDTSRRASPWLPVTPPAARATSDAAVGGVTARGDDAPDPGADEHTSDHSPEREGQRAQPAAVPTPPSSASPELEELIYPGFDTPRLTPAKPPRPSAPPRTEAPTPIEVDDAEIVPAFSLPDAAETFPTAPATAEIEVVPASGEEAHRGQVPLSPYLAAFSPPRAGADAATGSTAREGATEDSGETREPSGHSRPTPASAPAPIRPRKLAPSAAALLSAGAFPSPEEPPAFVPRYEPAHAEAPAESPLAHATIEDSSEPAYTPQVPAPATGTEPGGVRQVQHSHQLDDGPPTAPESEDHMAAIPTDGATSATTADQASETPGAAPASAPPEPFTDAGDGGFSSPPPVSEHAGHGDSGNNGGSGSFLTSTAFLVVLGILIMAGIGYAIFALFFKPVDTLLPVQTVVGAPVPAQPTLSPVVPTDASDFLAAMPATVGAYALTDYMVISADDSATLPEGATLPDGVAEQNTLTYSDGTHQVVVDAWQTYGVSAAQAIFDGLNLAGTDSQPVTVDGQDVGVQVNIASAAGLTVLWTNGTAVFSATGSDDTINKFVDEFGF